jgi:hypothetical protein
MRIKEMCFFSQAYVRFNFTPLKILNLINSGKFNWADILKQLTECLNIWLEVAGTLEAW